MDSVVHFEMPYENPERAAKFYTAAFGWRMQMLGKDMGDYVLATTTETDEKGPTKPGAINGGMYRKEPKRASQCMSMVIAVDDIKQAMKNVAAAGGKVIDKPVDIPGVGQYVSFEDTEGNVLSILQPVPRNWHAPSSK
jgi:uncharacterized protein